MAAAFAGALAFAVGCGGGEGGGDRGDGEGERDGRALTVIIEPSEVAPGEPLRARVENGGQETFIYGAGYGLEREVEGEFETVEVPRRPIPQIAHVAEPGGTGPPITVEVPENAQAGRWRVVIPPDVPGEEPPTGEFTVSDG